MDHRTFLSALVFVAKTGCWWIHLPQTFGKYKTIHSRFSAWANRDVFRVLFEAVRDSGDPSVLRFVDTTFVKCSIAALTGRCGEKQRVVGKTKGGFTTKIAAICDTNMRVHECRIDPGNDSDHKVAKRIELPGKDKKLVGDKGFSSKSFRERIENEGHRHCIAQKSNEKLSFAFHKGHYRLRHKIENVFAKMGRWTRLELRRERRSTNFASIVNIWAIGTWLHY